MAIDWKIDIDDMEKRLMTEDDFSLSYLDMHSIVAEIRSHRNELEQCYSEIADKEKTIANFQGYNMITKIDNLPENSPLYKDSGAWQVRSDDMEDVLFQQKPQETTDKFIERVFYSTNKPEDVIIKDL